MLEDLGLRVIEEIPTRLRGRRGDVGAGVPRARARRPPLDLDDVGDRVAEAIAAVCRGDAESDTLNRLVVTAGLDRGQVAILRAYRKYRQRIGSRFTEGYQNDVLVANRRSPPSSCATSSCASTPTRARRGRRGARCARRSSPTSTRSPRSTTTASCATSSALIDATLRTNAFKEDRGATAFKLRSADVPAIPQPAPLFEIYVYSPDDGGHPPARRPDRPRRHPLGDRMDYRTEVFGLMRAQLTKNAVIVPAGAKGGFILKRPRTATSQGEVEAST